VKKENWGEGIKIIQEPLLSILFCIPAFKPP
jgi:hypothetical protein